MLKLASSVTLSLFLLHFNSCRASPVSGDKLLHSPSKVGTKGKGLQIDSSWLSLGLPGSSSTLKGKDQGNIEPSLPLRTHSIPSTLLHSSRYADKEVRLPSASKPHWMDDLATTSSSSVHKGTSDVHLDLAAGVKEDKDRALAMAEARIESATVGKQKRLDLEHWLEKYPDRSPPVRLFAASDLLLMGSYPRGNRYKMINYLEEMQMRKDKIDWPRLEVEQPNAKYSLKPLDKEVPIHKPLLVKKQAEMNKMLDDHGLLQPSSSKKRGPSELTSGYKRVRKERQGAYLFHPENN